MSLLARNLCWTCANAHGYSLSQPAGAAIASTYQFDKFMKHTQPRWVHGINSVFNDPSTAAYARYTVTSLASGSVALDRYGQPSFIWYAGETIGATYERGLYKFSNDAVQVVLPYNQLKFHAYSVSSSGYNATQCQNCGTPILG